MVRKKGNKPFKVEPQFQPDYVKEAKQEAERKKKNKAKFSKEEMEALKRFYRNKNPNVRYLGEENEQSR